MRRRERARNREAGFTLAEVLVSLLLGLMVASVMAVFNRFQLFTLANQAVQLDVQGTARAITDLVSSEIRRAGLNATPAFCGIADAQWNEIRIQSDHDGNGFLNGANEDVTYRFNLSENAIERVDHGTGQADVLVEGLRTVWLSLRYFDRNGTELPGIFALNAAGRSAVHRVRLSLILSEDAVDPTSSQNFWARAGTDIELRNRFYAGANVNPQPCT